MMSILIDTNVFIRFLIGDVADHLKKATEIFSAIEKGTAQGHVSLLVINEIVWIMEHFYTINRSAYIPRLQTILALKGIKIREANKQLLMDVLNEMKTSSLDFTDLYLLRTKETMTLITFDKKLLKK